MKKKHNLNSLVMRLMVMNLMVLVILFLVVPPTITYATSASTTFKTNKKSITKGDTFTVNLYVESETEVGDFEAFVTYNQDVLEFVTNTSFIAGGDGLIKISDNNVVEGSTLRKYAFSFTAIEAGKSEISFQENPDIFDFESGANMSISVTPLNITVNPVVTASSNNNLQTLKMSGVTLDKEFKKDNLEYKAEVLNTIDKLIINAIPEDERATVAIDGNMNLVEGDNIVTITVTSESKESKKYKIIVNKLKAPDIIDNVTDIPKDLLENYVELSTSFAWSEGDKSYIKFGEQYELVERNSNVQIPGGYTEQVIQIGDIRTVVYINTVDEDSDYVLLYAKNAYGHIGFYQYDRIEETMQRYNESSTIVEEEAKEEENAQEEQLTSMSSQKNNQKILLTIVVILIVLLIVSSIVIAKLYLNKK